MKVPALPPTWIVPPLTSALIVPWLRIVPVAKPLVIWPVLPRTVIPLAIVSVPPAPLWLELLAIELKPPPPNTTEPVPAIVPEGLLPTPKMTRPKAGPAAPPDA